MHFISAEQPGSDIMAGDITLTAGGFTVGLDVTQYAILAGDRAGRIRISREKAFCPARPVPGAE